MSQRKGKRGDLLRIFSAGDDPFPISTLNDLPSFNNFHEKDPHSLDKLANVQIGWYPHEITSISADLEEKENDKLIKLLCINHRVFAWSFNQILGSTHTSLVTNSAFMHQPDL